MSPYECVFGIKPRLPEVPGSPGQVVEREMNGDQLLDHSYAQNTNTAEEATEEPPEEPEAAEPDSVQIEVDTAANNPLDH